MDGDRVKGAKDTERHEEKQHSHDQFPAPTIADPPSPSTSSHVSERSVLDAAAHVHPPTPDMDGPDGYVRKRPSLLDHEDPHTAAKSEKRSRSRQVRRKASQTRGDDENKHTVYSSDDGQSSMFSTPSTSEDVEMERLPSDDALTDDEETGLTGNDKRKRTRRRTLNSQLDERVAGSMSASTSRWSLADRNVIKASLINALLIASWYLFSVSISVVCYFIPSWMLESSDTYGSTTGGCLAKKPSISTFPYSLHACTWLFSSFSQVPFCMSSHDSGPERTVSPTPEIDLPHCIASKPKGSRS